MTLPSQLNRSLIIAGLALLSLGMLSFLAGGDPTVGDPATVEESLTTTTARATAPEAPVTIPGGDDPAPERSLPRWSPNPEAPLVDSSGPRPVRLVVEAIGVDAPIEPYGVDSRTGQMDVPNNVSDIAWYRYGPRPGEAGSAVLAAHVDLVGQGPGVFFRLRLLEPGDVVRVAFADGSEARFRVEARATYQKDELPLEAIFSRRGSPVLTLVTCGGGFDRSASSYDSNVVVYAVPLGLESDPGLPPA